MPNNTPEDYKEAIRIKFEEEKYGGNCNYFNPPSQANLRDLCWKIFKLNSSTDDLKVYFDFFKFEFDPNNENTSTIYTDKFKKVGTFLKGDKKPAKIDTVNLAAILVDFELRPYPKFNKKAEIIEREIDISNDLKTTDAPKDSVIDNSKGSKEIDITLEEIEGKNTTGSVEGCPPKQPKSKNLLRRLKEISDLFWKRMKITILGAIIVLSSTVTIVHFIFPNKECMIWVKDHYEEKQRSDKGYCDNSYDDRYFDLKKIKVCDTTTFFKDGKPIVWYFRSQDSVEFFDRFAPYPYNTTKCLKPITRYMIGRYVKPCK